MASALQPIGNVYSPYGAAYNTTPYAIAAYVNRAPGQGYSVDLPSRLNPETLPYPCESWRRIRVASVLRWIYRKIAAHLSKSISISPSPYYSPLSLLPLFLPPPPPPPPLQRPVQQWQHMGRVVWPGLLKVREVLDAGLRHRRRPRGEYRRRDCGKGRRMDCRVSARLLRRDLEWGTCVFDRSGECWGGLSCGAGSIGQAATSNLIPPLSPPPLPPPPPSFPTPHITSSVPIRAPDAMLLRLQLRLRLRLRLRLWLRL